MGFRPPILPYRSAAPQRRRGFSFNPGIGGKFLIGLAFGLAMGCAVTLFREWLNPYAVSIVWIPAAMLSCGFDATRGYGMGLLVSYPMSVMIFFVMLCAK